MSVGSPEQDKPRWTLPPKREISPENLHISSFILAKRMGMDAKDEGSILLLRAGDKHPLGFRRGKLVLPATILSYGEKPREGARRALSEQLQDSGRFKDPEFLLMRSFLGAHWDIVFLFETQLEDSDPKILSKEPFVEASFFEIRRLPRAEIAEDHLEVVDSVLNPADD